MVTLPLGQGNNKKNLIYLRPSDLPLYWPPNDPGAVLSMLRVQNQLLENCLD